MKKIWQFIMIGALALTLTACGSQTASDTGTKDTGSEAKTAEKIKVAVTIIPEATFVEKVGGDRVEVVTMVPPGASPENYQVSPKQMVDLSDSQLYFSIGIGAENGLVDKFESLNKSMKRVPLETIVGEKYPDRFFEAEEEHDHDHDHETAESHEGHHHEGRDPHIWLSPKRAMVMVESIRDEIIALDPEHKEVYTQNAAAYLKELEGASAEVQKAVDAMQTKAFIMYHPAFGYFADDFGLKMVEIEEDGKQASAARIKEVIDFAKSNDIHYIFYQEEFDSQQAETIASEIGGAAVKVAPLAPDYVQNLKDIVEALGSVTK